MRLLRQETNWWLGLAGALPVVFLPRSFDLFGATRFLTLSVFLLAFLAFFYIFHAPRTQTPAPRPATRALLALALGYLVLQAVSSCFALNRMEAVLETLQYGLAVLTTVLFARTVTREESLIPRLCKGIALVLAVQSLVAISQYYGFLFTQLDPAVSKPNGLLPNRNLLASFLALATPFCAYLACAGTLPWKAVGAVALWLGFYGVILGQTRSAWLALGCGVAIGGVCVLWQRRRLAPGLAPGGQRVMVVSVAGTCLAVLLVVVIMNQKGLAHSLRDRAASLWPVAQSRAAGAGNNNTDASGRERSIPTGAAAGAPTRSEPVSEESAGLRASIEARVVFWQKCLAIARDRPLLGVGPGNWRIVVPKYGYYEAFEQPNHGGSLTVPDRAHNVYLQAVAETGIPGGLIYAGIWGLVFFIALRAIPNADTNDKRILGIACLAVIVIHAVDACFSFPNESLAHSLYVAFAIGMAIGLYEKRTVSPPRNSVRSPLSTGALTLAVLLLATCAGLGYVRQDFQRRLWKVAALVGAQRHEEALAEAAAVRYPWVDTATGGKSLDSFVARAHMGLGRLDQALEALQHARRTDPWNLATLSSMGDLNLRMQRLDEAIRYYREALTVAPRFNYILKNLGQAYFSKGLCKEACDTLVKSDYADHQYFIELLGKAFFVTRDFARAAEVFRAGLKRFPEAVEMLAPLAWLEYSVFQNPAGARVYFQRLIELSPNDPKRGDYERAIADIAARIGQTGAQGPR